MLKLLRLFLLVIIVPILYSGCMLKKWASEMWKDDKLPLIGGIVLVLAIIVFLFLRLLKKSESTKSGEPDDISQDFEIEEESTEEDPNYKTEVIDINKDKIENEIIIEKEEQKNPITISIKGENIGTFNVPSDGAIIGRDPSKATVVISEAIVSKSHLKIIPDGEKYIVEDLNSTNGTYVDGDLISKSVITTDDTILIGKKGNIAINFK